MSPEGWEELLLAATEDVRTKVAPIARTGKRRKTVGGGASGDMTILADKVAEDALLGALLEIDGVRVLSEEAGRAGAKNGDTLAIVDPLDGSSNFERGIPFYCTSVAVAEGGSIGSISAGVVRDLVTGDVYHAVKGKGARKNGGPIRTSRASRLAEAVVGVDLSSSTPALVSGLAPLVTGAKRHVHLGANALELCYLADGTIDAFVDVRGRIRITDFAAAYLIAKEAGATITGPGGAALDPEFDLEHRFSFVGSANASLHGEILRLTAPGKSGG